jgi:hypothetical protein
MKAMVLTLVTLICCHYQLSYAACYRCPPHLVSSPMARCPGPVQNDCHCPAAMCGQYNDCLSHAKCCAAFGNVGNSNPNP